MALLLVAIATTSGCGHGAPDVAPVVASLRPAGHVSPTSNQLRVAASVMGRRLSTATGKHVLVTVVGERLQVRGEPSASAALASLLELGHLEFRPVLELEPVGAQKPAPAATPVRSGAAYSLAAFRALDCTQPETRRGGAPDRPDAEVVACDAQRIGYHLAPAVVTAFDLQGARANPREAMGSTSIFVSFNDEGQKRFTEMTRRAVGMGSPHDQVAMILDGLVLTAPTIQAVISGDAQITGGFTLTQARWLAAVIDGGPLPFALEVVD